MNKELMETLAKAKARLVLSHPFFAAAVLRRPVLVDNKVPTAAVDSRGQVYLNPEWCAKLKIDQMVFLLAHEAMHFMLLHGLRRGERPQARWNVACDAVINETLLASNVGEFIDGGITWPGAEAMSAEAVYNAMPEGTEGGGIGDDIQDGDGELTPAEARELEAQIKIELAQAVRAAEMQGNMPAALKRLVESIIHVPTPWHDILERYMTGYRNDEIAWSRPNRRYLAQGMMLPGANRVPEMGEVVIAVDTSGSVDDAMLAHFAGHITRIMEDCRPSKVHVVYCDARVSHTEEYDDVEDVRLTMHGGGGTAFKPVFDWVEGRGLSPDVLVYLTDLYGDTTFDAPPYDTLWVSTGADRADFGTVIRYEV